MFVMCLFVCRWVLWVGIVSRWGLSYVFTVWYICTPVACDSRYTLSTVRVTSSAAYRSLS